MRPSDELQTLDDSAQASVDAGVASSSSRLPGKTDSAELVQGWET